MNQSPSFEQIMQKLAPTIDRLEQVRSELFRDAKNKSMLYGGLTIVISLIVSLIATSTPAYGLLFGFLLVILETTILFNIRGNRLSPKYKKELIGKMVEELIENGNYQPEAGISEASFNETGLFNSPDRYHSEDLISGQTGKTPFCFAEVHAEEKHTTTNSKGQTRTYWETLFKGFMFIADFNKDFNGHTIILRDSFLNFARGNRVKLENTAFEKLFDVFSTDQIEARYILTPSMMERMIKLDELSGNNILFSFHHSKIVIMIKTSRNHFESKLTRPVNETKTLQEEYDTITGLTSIVEALDLNTRIWSKE